VKSFISYNHEDKGFVLELFKNLQANLVETPWLDKFELKVSDSLPQKIEAGIHLVDALITVLSKNSIDAPWVQKEFELAQESNKLFIPILKENIQLPDWYQVQAPKYANFTKTYEHGLFALLEILGPDCIQPWLPIKFNKSDWKPSKDNGFEVLVPFDRHKNINPSCHYETRSEGLWEKVSISIKGNDNNDIILAASEGLSGRLVFANNYIQKTPDIIDGGVI